MPLSSGLLPPKCLPMCHVIHVDKRGAVAHPCSAGVGNSFLTRSLPSPLQDRFTGPLRQVLSADLVGGKMKSRKLMCVAVLTLLAVPTAVARSKWYVDGVNG